VLAASFDPSPSCFAVVPFALPLPLACCVLLEELAEFVPLLLAPFAPLALLVLELPLVPLAPLVPLEPSALVVLLALLELLLVLLASLVLSLLSSALSGAWASDCEALCVLAEYDGSDGVGGE
jgi:hypothetical protein